MGRRVAVAPAVVEGSPVFMESKIPPKPEPPYATTAAPAVAPPQPQPTSFSVTVPPGVTPGMTIQVTHPTTGNAVQTVVPQGVAPGGTFTIEINAVQSV